MVDFESQFVALFPQDIKQSEQYLKDNGIGIQDVKQSMPFSVGANGFPTLMLVDNTCTVTAVNRCRSKVSKVFQKGNSKVERGES